MEKNDYLFEERTAFLFAQMVVALGSVAEATAALFLPEAQMDGEKLWKQVRSIASDKANGKGRHHSGGASGSDEANSPERIVSISVQDLTPQARKNGWPAFMIRAFYAALDEAVVQTGSELGARRGKGWKIVEQGFERRVGNISSVGVNALHNRLRGDGEKLALDAEGLQWSAMSAFEKRTAVLTAPWRKRSLEEVLRPAFLGATTDEPEAHSSAAVGRPVDGRAGEPAGGGGDGARVRLWR